MLLKVWQYRELLLEFTRREIANKYKGSIGGVIWVIVQPLLVLLVYTFAFGVIMQHRVGGVEGSREYALWMFLGLIFINAISECMNKSVLLIVGNQNYVKKVSFPLELFPVSVVISIFVQALISFTIWIIVFSFYEGTSLLAITCALFVMFSFVPVLLGVSWLLSSLAVYVRDIVYVVGMISQALIFITPVFFSVEQAPSQLRIVLMVNPLSIPIEQLRDIFFHDVSPDFPMLALYFLVATAFSILSYFLFVRSRPNFGDLV